MGRGPQGVSTRQWSEFKHHADMDCGAGKSLLSLTLFSSVKWGQLSRRVTECDNRQALGNW